MISQVLGLIFGKKDDEEANIDDDNSVSMIFQQPVKRKRGRPPSTDRKQITAIPKRGSETSSDNNGSGGEPEVKRKRGRPAMSDSSHVVRKAPSDPTVVRQPHLGESVIAAPNLSYGPSSSFSSSSSLGFVRRSRRYRPPDPHKELLVIMPGEDPAVVLEIPMHERDEFIVSFNEPLDYEDEDDADEHGSHSSATASMIPAGILSLNAVIPTAEDGPEVYTPRVKVITAELPEIAASQRYFTVLPATGAVVEGSSGGLTAVTAAAAAGTSQSHSKAAKATSKAAKNSNSSSDSNSSSKGVTGSTFRLPPVGDTIPGYDYTEYDIDSDDEEFVSTLPILMSLPGNDSAVAVSSSSSSSSASLDDSNSKGNNNGHGLTCLHLKHMITFLERELHESKQFAPLVQQAQHLNKVCNNFIDETRDVLNCINELFAAAPCPVSAAAVLPSVDVAPVAITVSLLDQPASLFTLANLKIESLSVSRATNVLHKNSGTGSSPETKLPVSADYASMMMTMHSLDSDSEDLIAQGQGQANTLRSRQNSFSSVNNNSVVHESNPVAAGNTVLTPVQIRARVPETTVSNTLVQIYLQVDKQLLQQQPQPQSTSSNKKSKAGKTALLHSIPSSLSSGLQATVHRVYEYWVSKRSSRTSGSSLLRCYHDFMMENWSQCSSSMPKLVSEDLDIESLLRSYDRLCSLRRDMDRARLIVDRLRRREKLKRELIKIAGEHCEGLLVTRERERVAAEATASGVVRGHIKRAAKTGAIKKMIVCNNLMNGNFGVTPTDMGLSNIALDSMSAAQLAAATAASMASTAALDSDVAAACHNTINNNSSSSSGGFMHNNGHGYGNSRPSALDNLGSCSFVVEQLDYARMSEYVIPVPMLAADIMDMQEDSEIDVHTNKSQAAQKCKPRKPAINTTSPAAAAAAGMSDSDRNGGDSDSEEEETDDDEEDEEDDDSDAGQPARVRRTRLLIDPDFKSSFCSWEMDEDKLLLMGVASCGLGRWRDIRDHYGLLRNSAQMNQRFTRLARRRVTLSGGVDRNVETELTTSKQQSPEIRSNLPPAVLKLLGRFHEKEVWRQIILRHLFDAHHQEKRSGRPIKFPMQLPPLPKEFKNKGFLKFEDQLAKPPPMIKKSSKHEEAAAASYTTATAKDRYKVGSSKPSTTSTNHQKAQAKAQQVVTVSKSGRLVVPPPSIILEQSLELLNKQKPNKSKLNKSKGKHGQAPGLRKRGRPRKDANL